MDKNNANRPRTDDLEIKKKYDEAIVMDKALKNLKNVITNFTQYFEKTMSYNRDIIQSIFVLYDNNEEYKEFATILTQVHVDNNKLYRQMNADINDLNTNTKDWPSYFSQLKVFLLDKEESRRNYDHYEQKLEKLCNEKENKLGKGYISESFNKKVERNEEKFIQAKLDYTNKCIAAHDKIDKLLSERFNLINQPLLNLFFLEMKMYQSFSSKYTTYKDLEEKLAEMRKQFDSRDKVKYDPTVYMKNPNLEHKFNIRPKHKKSNNEEKKHEFHQKFKNGINNNFQKKEEKNNDLINLSIIFMDNQQSEVRKPTDVQKNDFIFEEKNPENPNFYNSTFNKFSNQFSDQNIVENKKVDANFYSNYLLDLIKPNYTSNDNRKNTIVLTDENANKNMMDFLSCGNNKNAVNAQFSDNFNGFKHHETMQVDSTIAHFNETINHSDHKREFEGTLHNFHAHNNFENTLHNFHATNPFEALNKNSSPHGLVPTSARDRVSYPSLKSVLDHGPYDFKTQNPKNPGQMHFPSNPDINITGLHYQHSVLEPPVHAQSAQNVKFNFDAIPIMQPNSTKKLELDDLLNNNDLLVNEKQNKTMDLAVPNDPFAGFY